MTPTTAARRWRRLTPFAAAALAIAVHAWLSVPRGPMAADDGGRFDDPKAKSQDKGKDKPQGKTDGEAKPKPKPKDSVKNQDVVDGEALPPIRERAAVE